MLTKVCIAAEAGQEEQYQLPSWKNVSQFCGTDEEEMIKIDQR